MSKRAFFTVLLLLIARTADAKQNFTYFFKDKVVLITGGTGFLGRALTRKILDCGAGEVRVFSRDEVKHYNFARQFQDGRIHNIVGDIRDLSALENAMVGVDYVIHAAALKRLDTLEFNGSECVKTNVIGTENVVQAARRQRVKRVVFVSTDKACSPINIYGACKFVGEKLFANAAAQSNDTIFSVVRYGNVLQSTGSVIPLFSRLIDEGRAITLTDPRMTRFIIHEDEAVDLVFSALFYAVGGEIFVPRLPAFKITDLIDILKRRAGKDVDVVTIGMRPGEKLHELMINISELDRTYEFKNMYVILPSIYSMKYDGTPYETMGNKAITFPRAEYSSEDAVLECDKVENLLISYNILPKE